LCVHLLPLSSIENDLVQHGSKIGEKDVSRHTTQNTKVCATFICLNWVEGWEKGRDFLLSKK
jgi:hypothetical protein